MVSKQLRLLFGGPRWRVRRATYASLIVLSLAFITATQTVTIFAKQSEVAQLRSFLYMMIVLFEGVGAINLRLGYGYGHAYQVEKGIGAVGFTGLSAANAVGLTGTTFQLVVWFVVLIVAKVIAFEWIVSRNAIMDSEGLNTALGKIPPPRTREEVVAVGSAAAAYARHGFFTDEDREELWDALGAPPINPWARATRDRLLRRRERAGALQAAGIDVEANDLDPNDEASWPEVPRRG